MASHQTGRMGRPRRRDEGRRRPAPLGGLGPGARPRWTRQNQMRSTAVQHLLRVRGAFDASTSHRTGTCQAGHVKRGFVSETPTRQTRASLWGLRVRSPCAQHTCTHAHMHALGALKRVHDGSAQPALDGCQSGRPECPTRIKRGVTRHASLLDYSGTWSWYYFVLDDPSLGLPRAWSAWIGMEQVTSLHPALSSPRAWPWHAMACLSRARLEMS